MKKPDANLPDNVLVIKNPLSRDTDIIKNTSHLTQDSPQSSEPANSLINQPMQNSQ